MQMAEDSKSPVMIHSNEATTGQHTVMSNTSAGASSLPHNRWLDNNSSVNVMNQLKSPNLANMTFESIGPNNVQSCTNHEVSAGFGQLPKGVLRSGSALPTTQPLVSHYYNSYGTPEHSHEQFPYPHQAQLGQVMEEDANTLTSKEDMSEEMSENSGTFLGH